LPWFGGSPAVWTTCLLFFQLLLLAGYAFADWLSRWPQPRRQAVIFLSLLGLALWTLPITPGDYWKPRDGTNPAGRILLLLAAKIGLPYFLLAAASPTLQVWYARVHPGRSPYRLYALSNAGSLGALLSYPLLVEPAMTTRWQGYVWSVLFGLFVAICAWLALRLWHLGTFPSLSAGSVATAERVAEQQPSWPSRVSWVCWPALSCVLLMAVTNHLCQDLAVVPLLWVVPLSLYLLSFIICFDREAWYHRRGFALAASLAALTLSILPFSGPLERSLRQIGWTAPIADLLTHMLVEALLFLLALFLLCMVCHGELVRCKPPASHLTRFYLSIAAGGALGGVIVAVICPMLFASYIELNVAVLVGFLTSVAVLVAELGTRDKRWSKVLKWGVLLIALLSTVVVAWGQYHRWSIRTQAVARVRNFYGVLSVRELFSRSAEHRGRALLHGGTLHGYQLLDDDAKNTPTAYYCPRSGVGLTLRNIDRDEPVRVGAIGLGAGTIAAYGRPGDVYRFYEINPLVVDIARQYFTFLDDSDATIEIVLGDARLSLEREPPQHYDLLVLDAFSSDSIPVHLLTREAMEVYLRQLAPRGIIALHISNDYVNLTPVVLELAHHFGLSTVRIRQRENDGFRSSTSVWMLLTRNDVFLEHESIRSASDHPTRWPGFPLWTDQYQNLLRILYPLADRSGIDPE
jgi:hypothetical protein